jgi:hypothetical protein
MKPSLQTVILAVALSAASAHAAEQSNGSLPNGLSPNALSINKITVNRIASNPLAIRVGMTLDGKTVPAAGHDPRHTEADGTACGAEVFRALSGHSLVD